MSRFDEKAKDWDKKQTTVDKTDACVKNLKKHLDFSKIKNILDYGCGTGLVAFSLIDTSKEILGLDSSNGMVEEFNNKAKNKAVHRTAFFINWVYRTQIHLLRLPN